MTRLFLEIKNITLCAEPSFFILLYFLCTNLLFLCTEHHFPFHTGTLASARPPKPGCPCTRTLRPSTSRRSCARTRQLWMPRSRFWSCGDCRRSNGANWRSTWSPSRSSRFCGAPTPFPPFSSSWTWVTRRWVWRWRRTPTLRPGPTWAPTCRDARAPSWRRCTRQMRPCSPGAWPWMDVTAWFWHGQVERLWANALLAMGVRRHAMRLREPFCFLLLL